MSQNEAGIGVTALFRDMLVATGKFSYKESEEISQTFDKEVAQVDWLSTLNGTTFTKSFTPGERKVYDVDVIASGYEFTCPRCQRLGFYIELQETYACDGCGATLHTANYHHAHKGGE